MTTIVSEREEQAFLDYLLDLARKEMASSVGQDSDEATEVRPVSGALSRKDSTMTDTERTRALAFLAWMCTVFMALALVV